MPHGNSASLYKNRGRLKLVDSVPHDDNHTEPYYVLRSMRTTDLEQVTGIEHQSFSMPWSPLTYLYEINQNRNASYGSY